MAFLLVIATAIFAPIMASASTFPQEIMNMMISAGSNGTHFSLKDVVSEMLLKTGNPLAAFALSLVALFFVIETLNKSVSFEKVTIEMVVKLLIRLLIAKILVENASSILWQLESIILETTKGLVTAVQGMGDIGTRRDIGSLFRFQPGMSKLLASVSDTADGFLLLKSLFTTLGNGALPSALQLTAAALIKGFSGIAFDLIVEPVRIKEATGIDPIAATGRWTFAPFAPDAVAIYVSAILIGWIIRILVEGFVKIQIVLTLFLRAIELVMLAYLAPIAMAFFVSDEFKGQTKKFIIQFATICVQGLVIVVICGIMDSLFTNPFMFTDSPSGFIKPGYDEIFTAINYGVLDPWRQHWGYLQPIKMILFSIIEPIVLGMLIGKSRAMASSLMGG